MNLYAWRLFTGQIVYTDTKAPVADIDVIYKEDGTPYTDGELKIDSSVYGTDTDIEMSNVITSSYYDIDPYITLVGAATIDGEEVSFNLNFYQYYLTSEIKHGNVVYTVKDALAREKVLTKQDTLVSGTNIKTINNNSILGSGNINIDSLPSQSGNSGKVLTTNGATARWDYGETIKNQNNTQTSPVRLWTGNETEFKQEMFIPWGSITPPYTSSSGPIFSKCYGNGKFLLMVGWGYSDDNYIYSTDGLNWRVGNAGVPGTTIARLRSRWVHDRFVSLCANGIYQYSFDGINWITGTLPFTNINPWDITYGNGKFVVIFSNCTNTSLPLNKVAYTSDFENWATATITDNVGSSDTRWYTLTFFKNKFIAFRYASSMVAYSEDAINWTTTTISNFQYGTYWWVDHSDDVCVACCNGQAAVCVSTDGINWTERATLDVYRFNVIYDGKQFVLLPSGSGDSAEMKKVQISTDGVNWTYSNIEIPLDWSSGDQWTEYLSAVYGDNKLIAVNVDSGKIKHQGYSQPIGSNHYLSFIKDKQVQLGDNILVKSDDNNNVESIKNQNPKKATPVGIWTGNETQYKQNSLNIWQTVTSPITLTVSSGCYGAGKYLFVKGNFEEGNDYIYSTDGITWTAATSALQSDNCYKSKTKWVNDRFVSLNWDGQYEYSFDGISWTTGTLPIADQQNYPWDIAYGNGKYVVVFQNATNTSLGLNKVAYSTDCVNWTVATINNEVGTDQYMYWRTITFFKGKFIAFRLNSSMIAYSEDAITWTTVTTVNWRHGNYYSVVNNDDICVACCNGKDGVAISTDGVNWIEHQIPDAYRSNVIYDGVRFVLLPHHRLSDDGKTNTILTSIDGLNWTYSNKQLPTICESPASIYANNKLFAAPWGSTDIYVQNYIPVNVSNPEYLSFVENKKILLGNDEIINMNNKQDKNLIFTNVSASIWVSDNTLQDYGYKCEITCSGVNENMFATVVFGIEEANSGNYASVCDTAENKVIIYSKVNDTITIPTIVVMEA